MLANILQVSGAVLISVGAAIVWLPAGIILAGIASIIFGLALERK
jgi:putative exporter of polyketide antibiotics